MQKQASSTASKIASLIAKFEQAEQQLQRSLSSLKSPKKSDSQKQPSASTSPQKPPPSQPKNVATNAAPADSRSSSRTASTSSDAGTNPTPHEVDETIIGLDGPVTFSPKKSDVKSPRMVFTPPQAMLVLAPADHDSLPNANATAAHSKRTSSGDPYTTSDYDSFDTHSSHSMSSSDSATPRGADSQPLDDPGGSISPPLPRSPRSGYSQVNRRAVPALKLRALNDSPNQRIHHNNHHQQLPQQQQQQPSHQPHFNMSQQLLTLKQTSSSLEHYHHHNVDNTKTTNTATTKPVDAHADTMPPQQQHFPPIPTLVQHSRPLSVSSSSSSASSSNYSDSSSSTVPEEEQMLQKLPINTELTEKDVIPLPSPAGTNDGSTDSMKNGNSGEVDTDPTKILLSSRPTPIVDALRGGTPTTPRLHDKVTEEVLLTAYREKSKLFMRHHPDSLFLNPFLPATGSSCLSNVETGSSLPLSPSAAAGGGGGSRSRPILRTPKSARSKSNGLSKTDRSTREETKDDFRAWKQDMERKLAEAKKSSPASASWSSSLQTGAKRSPSTARPHSAKFFRDGQTPPAQRRDHTNCLSADGVDLEEECV